jgi:hypothetical protein
MSLWLNHSLQPAPSADEQLNRTALAFYLFTFLPFYLFTFLP